MNRTSQPASQPFKIGQRIEIPVHYDRWMQGARFGEITSFHPGKDGQSDYYCVKMDHPQVKRRVRLWRLDWPYARSCSIQRSATV